MEGSDERKRKASQEKFVPFARFLLEKYNLDLFYLSLEFLFRFRRFVSPIDVGIYSCNFYFIFPDLFRYWNRLL